MAETNEPPADSPDSEADAPPIAEEAEEAGAEAQADALETESEDSAEEAPAGPVAAGTLEDPAEQEAASASPRRLGRLRGRLRPPKLSTLAQAAAILLILAFVSFSGYTVWQHHEAEERQQRAAAFVAGAKQGVVNMTSLDFNKAKDDVQRVIDSSTGEFKDEFQQRAADFTKVIEQSKVVTEGTVNAAAVVSMDEHSAVVLVSATSHITNSTGAKNEPLPWRLRVTVTEEGGQYKMSKVEFVQ
jgi:Mce-associated membrane protein